MSEKGIAEGHHSRKWISRHHIVRNLKAEADAKRTLGEKIADWLTLSLGSIHFLIFNLLFFALWIFVNSGLLAPVIPAFDTFPFGLLTMIVSLEAIALAIIVLISQNRSAKIFDLREEIDLNIDVAAQQETTKILELLVKLLEKNNIDVSRDEMLQFMLRPTDTMKLEEKIQKKI